MTETKKEDEMVRRARELLAALKNSSPNAFIQGSERDVLIDGTFDLVSVLNSVSWACNPQG